MRTRFYADTRQLEATRKNWSLVAVTLGCLVAFTSTQIQLTTCSLPQQQQQQVASSNVAADLYAAASALDSNHHHYQHPSPCVLTIKPFNSSSSYSVTGPSSYLSNYFISGRPESYEPYSSAGPYGHYGQTSNTICIRQHDVDLAIEEAKASLGNYVPKEIYSVNSEMPKPSHVTVVAEIITQATRILANRFKLPEPAILYDLPALDLTKSHAIDKICPTFLKPSVNCEQTKYRTLTGFCNNIQYQSWGSARSAMVRFLAPDYYDSISLPRRSYDGSPLPSARVVSFVVHQDPQEYDKYHTMLSVVWGQFIDHDMTLAAQATDEQQGAFDCCKSEDAHPDCFPIEIPKGDPFYGYFNQKCMHFTRASPGLQPGCSLGPVQAINRISGYMDGNLVYGTGIKQNQRLRTYQGGQLRSQPVSSAAAYGSGNAYTVEQPAQSGSQHGPAGHEHAAAAAAANQDNANSMEYLLAAGSHQQRSASLEYPAVLSGQHAAAYKELLPAKRLSPDEGCERRGRAKDVYCFEAGDVRANEQIQLTTMHTMLMREHNRIARELSYINPYWDDERLFQEARQIVVAQLQHITFNEFLPLVIGKEKIYEYGLELEQPGRYYRGYDSKINAGIRVEFQAAAFRYGHSILPSHIERYNKFHHKIESVRLSKLLKQPYDLYHPGVLDSYLLGLINQRSGRMDPTLTTEVTNHLFEKPGKFFGIDLAAINIQRGRDMGVPGYNHFREYCGLPRAKYFEDLTGVFSNKTLLRMSQLYKHVDDIDLWTAGISEYPIQDGIVGPTFACLIARQFVNLRRGDRFWYENSGYPAQFRIEQLDEIRKSTSARLICDNSDDVETIQASPMLIPDHYTNPRVPCHSLPAIDLSKWRDSSAGIPYGPAPYQQPQQPNHHQSYQHQPQPQHNAEQHEDYNAAYHQQANGQHGNVDVASPIVIEEEYVKPSGAGPAEAYQATGLTGEYETLKNAQHHAFQLDHIVEAQNYRPETNIPGYPRAEKEV